MKTPNKALQHRSGFASTGQFVSSAFVVLLRKRFPQSHYLQTAAELSVRKNMSFIENYYGNERPSILRKITINSLIIALLFCFYGMLFGTLIVSETFLSALKVICVVTYIAMFFYLVNTNTKERLKKHIASSYKNIISKILATYGTIFISPILFGVLVCFSIYGFADVYTIIFGHKYENLAPLKKVYKQRKRGCDYYLDGDFFKRIPKNKNCLEYGLFISLPESHINVSLYGKESLFGVIITEWKINNS